MIIIITIIIMIVIIKRIFRFLLLLPFCSIFIFLDFILFYL